MFPTTRQHQSAPIDNAWTAHLELDEVIALADYTQTGYKENKNLYHPQETQHTSYTKLLDSALSKHTSVNPLKRKLYRAHHFNTDNAQPQLNKTISFPAYLSTTADPNLVPNYVNNTHSVILEFYTSKGVNIDVFSVKEGREEEFLIPRNTKFSIHNILTTDWDTLLVDETANISYEHCHLRNITVIQLVDAD